MGSTVCRHTTRGIAPGFRNLSDPDGIVEHMFDTARRAQAIARLEELFERHYPSATPESGALLERIALFSRVENRAAAEQLAAIGELFSYRLSRCSEREEWAVDTEAAVSAEVAAELRISQGLAASRIRYARAMRERLPKVGEVFRAGHIDFRLFSTIVYRTDLITDHDVLAAVDAELAIKVARWLSMTQGRLAAQVTRSWPAPAPMRCAAARSAWPVARCGSPSVEMACRISKAAC